MKYFYSLGIIVIIYGCISISRYQTNNKNLFSNQQIQIENSEISFSLPNNFISLASLKNEYNKTTLVNSDEGINIIFTPISIEDNSINSFEELLGIYNSYVKSPETKMRNNIIEHDDKKYSEIILEDENKLKYLVSYKKELIEISANCKKNNKFLTKEIIENIIKYLK